MNIGGNDVGFGNVIKDCARWGTTTCVNEINEGADVLAGVTQTATGNHGFAFGDVRPAFANDHEICDGSNSWLPVDAGDIGSSYHPTAADQSGGYLPVFSTLAG